MAIALAAAAIGAGASFLSAKKNSKAIRKSTQAQTAANDQSIALQKDIYGQNKAALDPFLQRGNQAGDAYNALLGFGAPETANAAFDTFKGSTGYQFRKEEGTNALNSAYAGAGTLRSGAAANAFQKYGQDYASNEFGNYMGYLGNQQGVGLQAGSALAGVGQNFANNVSNLNSRQADNISNSAVARANNSNSMIGGIASSFGNALGTFGQMGGFGAKAPTSLPKGFNFYGGAYG